MTTDAEYYKMQVTSRDAYAAFHAADKDAADAVFCLMLVREENANRMREARYTCENKLAQVQRRVETSRAYAEHLGKISLAADEAEIAAHAVKRG